MILEDFEGNWVEMSGMTLGLYQEEVLGQRNNDSVTVGLMHVTSSTPNYSVTGNTANALTPFMPMAEAGVKFRELKRIIMEYVVIHQQLPPLVLNNVWNKKEDKNAAD